MRSFHVPRTPHYELIKINHMKAKPSIIVESPTKVKTINKILGNKFKVLSSMGHLIDLPKSSLGVDVEHNFEPKLIVLRDKTRLLKQLKEDTKASKEIYFATDPDREGEAIGWNLVQHIGRGKKVFRVTFQEITKTAVLKAFENPREFDVDKINAQIARRILDRIVGYQISPLLWKKVGSRLSAGRVQSVALRLIVEREREILAFIPREYWKIAVDLKKDGHDGVMEANLEKIDGQKLELANQDQTQDLIQYIRKQPFVVSDISEKDVRRNPSPPYITSTLQQDAFNKLRFNANRTMLIAQQLYEGIDLGDGETVGLITYMRTDSVNVAKEALERVRGFISESYGAAYLPETPNVYKSKKSAQEAHEAIRPSDVSRRPEDVRAYVTDEQFRLYQLIWNRFVASQMNPAVYLAKKMEITCGKCLFGAAGSTLVFDGFLTLDREAREEDRKVDFSLYQKDDRLQLVDVRPTQHFTKPPPRYSDASLVKALEEDGIGRPSTYASIIQTIVERQYVMRDKGYLSPTDLGIKVCDLLVEYFAQILDKGFTAQMEENLDQVEEGKLQYPQLLRDFYTPFESALKHAEATIVRTDTFVDKVCPSCGRPMAVKWGRRGRFLSCSGFPECKYAESYSTDVPCPQPDCGGKLVQRRSTRGHFYGCTHYPKCTFVTRDLPKTKDNEAGPQAG